MEVPVPLAKSVYQPRLNPVMYIELKIDKVSTAQELLPICSQYNLSLPPENIRKPYGL